MSEATMRWPNFLIVGTARAGTTSLHEYLGNHPSVFMPLQKEPCFFTFYNEDPQFKDSRHRYTTTVDSYLELFREHDEQIIGESSTPYLYFHHKTIEHIKLLVPGYRQIRILIILRDPAERAYSQYMHNRRDLREQLSFADAVRDEEYRKKENWHFDFFYIDKGYYYEQVKEYLENFDHVKICFYDDLESNPQKLLNEIYRFLEVDPALNKVELQQKNQSGEMKVKWFKRIITTRKNPVLNFFRKLMGRNTKKKLRNRVKGLLLKYNMNRSEMDPRVRKELIEMYRSDILKLSQLIQTDLQHCLT